MTSRLAALIVTACLLAASLGAAIGLAFAAGWPSATGDRWIAITGIATIIVAVATTGALLGLYFVGRAGRRAWQRMRAEINPYLRVDFSLDVEGGTFRPPTSEIDTFTFADFNVLREKPATVLDTWFGDIDIALWLSNQQGGSGGIAHNVRVQVEVDVFAGHDSDEVVTYSETVHLHYL